MSYACVRMSREKGLHLSEISIFLTRNDWGKHTVSPMENVNQVCSTYSLSCIVPRSAEVFRRLVVYSTKEYRTNLQYIGMYSTDSYSTNIYTAHTYRYIQHIRTYKYVYTAHTYKYVYMAHTYKYMQYIRKVHTYKYIQHIRTSICSTYVHTSTYSTYMCIQRTP